MDTVIRDGVLHARKVILHAYIGLLHVQEGLLHAYTELLHVRGVLHA